MWAIHEVVVGEAAEANIKNLKGQCEELVICWIPTAIS